MAESLNRDAPFSQHQQRDAEAAVQAVYAAAADEVLDHDTRTLGRDLLALVTIFLIAVIHYVQNPLLRFEEQFGRAFRNDSLQNALALLLAVCVAVLIGRPRALRGKPVRMAAALALAIYALFGISVTLFDLHPLAPLYGVEQAAFQDQPRGDAPRAALEAAIPPTTVMAGLAIAAVVMLWQPWTRLPVYRRALSKQGAALIVAVLVLALWEVLIIIFQIQQFLLPRPSVIAATFLDTYPRLISAGWVTFQNAFWGFVIGCGAGILTGMAAARFASFSKALLPVAIAINAVPIIALAPIFNNWFGALNPASKIAIVAVLTYFPSMISTVRGLTAVDPISLELMRSYAASQWAMFRKLRVPTALPYIFSALKVATTLSMIGAIVSEYFGGSTAGLGFRIRDDAGLFRYAEAWSAILVASLFGILFYLAVSAVERAMLSWHVSFREK
ncbi:MAG: ABC transporter permease [Aggregatilineales bacterium]